MSAPRLPLVLAILAGCTHTPAPGEAIPNATCGSDDVRALIGTDGYLTVADAVAAASAGDTVKVCVGVYADNFTIDHPLTLEGAGAGRTVLVAPIGQTTVILDHADDVLLKGLSLHGNATIVESAGTNLTLDDVQLQGARSYGLDFSEGTLTVTGSEFSENELGGIYLRGGVANISESTFTDNRSFGVRGMEAAEVTVSGSTFSGTTYTGDGSATDGFGVEGFQGAVLTLDHNRFQDNIIGGVHVDGASVSLDGDTFFANYSGMWLDSPRSVRAKDVVIEQSTQYGIVLLSAHDAEFDNLQVLTDPETSMKHRVDDPSTTEDESFPGSYGMIAIDADLTIRGGVFSGNNEAGLALQPNLTTSVSLTASDVTFDNNTGLGVLLVRGSGVFTDVNIQNTRNNNEACRGADGIVCNFGLLGVEADIQWTGGALTGNEMDGIELYGSSLQAEDLTISQNGEIGVYMFESALTGTNLGFVNGAPTSIFTQDSALTLVGGRFQDGSFVSVSHQSDGTTIRRGNAGLDIKDISLDQGTIRIEGTQFSGGDQLIDLNGASAELSNITIDGYQQAAINLMDGSLLASNVQATQQHGTLLSCSYGAARLEQVTLASASPYEVWTETLDADGNPVSSTLDVRTAPAINLFACPFVAEGLDVAAVADSGLVAMNSSVELDRATFNDVGNAELSEKAVVDVFYSGSNAASVLLNNVELTGLGMRSALRIRGASAPADSVEISRLSVTSPALNAAGGNGVSLADLNDVQWYGLELEGMPTHGVSLDHVIGVIDGTALGAPGTITAPGAAGILATQATMAIRNVQIIDATGPGMRLTAGSLDLTDMQMSSTSDYGMLCLDAPQATPNPLPLPEFPACTNIGATGMLGSHDRCGACLP